MATYNPAYDYNGGETAVGQATQDLPSGGNFVNGYYYFYAPSQDGGFNFYKAANTGSGTNIQALNQADYAKEGGGHMSTWDTQAPGSNTGTGKTAAELRAAQTTHEANLRDLARRLVEGQSSFTKQLQSVHQSLDDLAKSRDQGLDSNAAYFNGLSPDASQSQMGNYNMKVLDAYQQGQNTAQDNTNSINQAQGLWEQGMNDSKAAENAFNPTTGDHSGKYNYTGGPTQTPAALVDYNANLPSASAARMGVYQWSPNSNVNMNQTQQTNQKPIDQALNA
jgi:hypothetical protein